MPTNLYGNSDSNDINVMLRQPDEGLYTTIVCKMVQSGYDPEEGTYMGAPFKAVDVNYNGEIFQIRFYNGYSGGGAGNSSIHFFQKGERMWTIDGNKWNPAIGRCWAKVILSKLITMEGK